MIVQPTVLVLGAGSSKTYGYPTGPELRDMVWSRLQMNSTHLFRAINLLGDNQPIERFRTDLIESSMPSVDAFLEHRPEYHQIGKAAIAGVILEHEQLDALGRAPSQPDKWHDVLWRHISAPPSEFISKNRLSVVTFNYDRSFEQAFFLKFKAAYGISDETAAACVKTLNVIHVHGRIQPLPFQNSNSGRRYGDDQINEATIRAAAAGIRIVHEGSDDAVLGQVADLVGAAKYLLLLGFGYHEQNVGRLGIPFHEAANRPMAVYGSAFNMLAGECHAARTLFQPHNLVLSEHDEDATVALRSLPALGLACRSG